MVSLPTGLTTLLGRPMAESEREGGVPNVLDHHGWRAAGASLRRSGATLRPPPMTACIAKAKTRHAPDADSSFLSFNVVSSFDSASSNFTDVASMRDT